MAFFKGVAMVIRTVLFLLCTTIAAPFFIYSEFTATEKTYTFKKFWEFEIGSKSSDSSISSNIDSIILKNNEPKKSIKTIVTAIMSQSFYKQNESMIFKVLKSLAGSYHFMHIKKTEATEEDYLFKVITIVCNDKDLLDEKISLKEMQSVLEKIKKIKKEKKPEYHVLMIIGDCVAPIWSFCRTLNTLESSPFISIASTVILLSPMVTQEMHDKDVAYFISLTQSRIYNIYSKPEYKVSTLFSWAMGNNNKRKMKPSMGKSKTTQTYKSLVQNMLVSICGSQTYDLQNWQPTEVQTAIKLIPFFTQDANDLFKIWPDIEVNITPSPVRSWLLKTRNTFELELDRRITFNCDEWFFEPQYKDFYEFAELFIKEKKFTYDSNFTG